MNFGRYSEDKFRQPKIGRALAYPDFNSNTMVGLGDYAASAHTRRAHVDCLHYSSAIDGLENPLRWLGRSSGKVDLIPELNFNLFRNFPSDQ